VAAINAALGPEIEFVNPAGAELASQPTAYMAYPRPEAGAIRGRRQV